MPTGEPLAKPQHGRRRRIFPRSCLVPINFSIIGATVERRGEADAIERVEAVVARNADQDDKTPLGESLERLAGRGDHDEAALLAEINSPEQREFWRIFFDEAVELDPFWSKTADGRYRCKRGAVHDTPEKLVAAYKVARKG